MGSCVLHGPNYSIWTNHGLVKMALDSKEAKYADEWAAALNEVYKPPFLPGVDDVVVEPPPPPPPSTFDDVVEPPPPPPGTFDEALQVNEVVEPCTFDPTASSSTLEWDPILEAELFGPSPVIALPWDWSR